MTFSMSTGPSWTEEMVAISTAALVIVAIVAAAIAIWQLDSLKAIDRRKLTLELIRQYTTPVQVTDYSGGPDRMVSPMQAYTNLANIIPATLKASGSGQVVKLTSYVAEAVVNYTLLRNFLDEVSDYYRHDMIDRGLYLSRHHNVVASGVEMLRRFADLVPRDPGDPELCDRLERIVRRNAEARDAAARRGEKPTLRSPS